MLTDTRPEVLPDPPPEVLSAPPRIAHRPALDGLRGLAVAAVVAHHFGYLPGGYLGVDLFFVLSGFLITSLLVSEGRTDHRISLSGFWTRRGRRLMPALFALLAFVALWARFGAELADRQSLRHEGLAGLFYVSNWQQIVSGVDYWSNFGALSPLRHLWSLAIEEQFYLVWPLVVALVVSRRGGRWTIATIAAFGVVASEVTRWVLFDPTQSTARVYFGTDTRIAAIFYGAVAACIMASPRRSRTSAGRRAALEVAAFISMAFLCVAWVGLEGTDPRLYRGGLTLCGIAAAIVVAAAAHRRTGRLGRALSWRPLRWLGGISYGLYLWHWPVVAILDEQRMGFGGWRLAMVWTVVSLALAEVSFHVIETPIRRGKGNIVILPVVAVIVALLLVWGTALSPAEARRVSVTHRAVGQVDKIPDALVAKAAAPAAAATSAAPTGVFPPFAAGTTPRVMFVGDSVSDSVGSQLQASNGTTGATVLNRALVGCPLISSVTKERTTTGQVMADRVECTRWRSVWSEGLAKFRPDAAVLLMGSANAADRWLGGAWRAPCSAEMTTWLTQRVGEAVDLLGAYVGRVAVATTPLTSFPSHQPDDLRTIGCKNDAIRAAVATRPKARIIELGEWVCPKGTCRTKLDSGELLRRDGMHFAEGAGALAAGNWLLGQLGVPQPR